MTKERKLYWGETLATPVPETATCAWGARAIYHTRPRSLDFLHDRQDRWGPVDGSTLIDFLGDYALAELERRLEESSVSTSEHYVVTIKQDGHTLVASPNGSCGYLYIVAYDE